MPYNEKWCNRHTSINTLYHILNSYSLWVIIRQSKDYLHQSLRFPWGKESKSVVEHKNLIGGQKKRETPFNI